MNRFVWICLSALLFSACLDKKKEVHVQETTVQTHVDTQQTVIDTIIPDSQEADPPQSVDEFFDDFIYSFSTNRHFQYRRITFPLPVCTNKDTTYLSRKEWTFNPMHSTEDVYVTLVSSEQQLSIEKDAELSKVNLEWIYLNKERIKQYIFQKLAGKWMLTGIRAIPLSSHRYGDFIQFYRHFASDSIFQRKHVAEYVNFATFDEDISEQEINGVVDIDQWFAFKPQLPTDIIVNIDYGQHLSTQGRRTLVFRGISNSMMNTLTFQRYEHLWRLVKFKI